MADLSRLAALIALAAAGGALFTWAGLPAAWLAGAMTATAAAVLAGFSVRQPRFMAPIIFIVLGLQIGASVTPETVAGMLRWPLSMAILFASLAGVVWTGMIFYRRLYGWDRATGFFATMPGALSMVLILAAQSRAHLTNVTIVQCIRLFVLVAILPGLITAAGPAGVPGAALAAGSLRDVVIVLGAGLVAAFAFEKLRVPAGLMLGPALANAVLHLAGVVEGTLPQWVLIPGFVLLGAMIGLRFTGIALADLRRLAVAGVGGLVLALAVSMVGAALATAATGMAFPVTLLAFSPGGLEAMTILAFALDLDPAYVGAHQIARFIGLSLFLPLVWRWLNRGGP